MAEHSRPTPSAMPRKHPEAARVAQLVQEEITKAARLVEQSIADGQPVAFAHTKPVTDLLNEVGTGDWHSLRAAHPEAAGAPHAWHTLSHNCFVIRKVPDTGSSLCFPCAEKGRWCLLHDT